MPAVFLATAEARASGASEAPAAGPRPVPSTSVGPSDRSEASVLWADSRRAFGEGRYGDAAYKLQRLVDRHPGFEGHLEAQLMLGLSLTRLGKAAEGVAPLKRYVEAAGATPDGYRGRLSLARAYIGTGKFHESLLSAIEVLDAAAASKAGPDLQYEALILKAKSHLALKQDFKAARTVSSADTAWSRLPEPERDVLVPLRAESLWSSLELKLRECDGLAARPPAVEAEVMAATERRGICLGEAVVAFTRILDTNDSHWSKESVSSLTHGFRKFWGDCMDPPAPPGKRSDAQVRQYKTELVGLLTGRCTERIETSLALLDRQDGGPAKSSGPGYREDVRKRVRGLYGSTD